MHVENVAIGTRERRDPSQRGVWDLKAGVAPVSDPTGGSRDCERATWLGSQPTGRNVDRSDLDVRESVG